MDKTMPAFFIKKPRLEYSKKITINVTGMHCAGCVSRITDLLNSKVGVVSAKVNLSAGNLLVEFIPGKIDERKIAEFVRSLGYGAGIDTSGNIHNDRQYLQNMTVAWCFTISAMLIMFIPMMSGIHLHFTKEIIIALSVPVIFFAGRKVIVNAYISIIRFSADMDLLIALGTSAAFITGPLSYFMAIPDYSGAASMVMAFHLTGRYLEHRSRRKTGTALSKLMELSAKTARVLRKGAEIEISAEELQVGDIMLIKPGEKIPADGKVLEGNSEIDESMATGEALPVSKEPGDSVIGSTLNGSGHLMAEVTATGNDTFLSRVINLVNECQSSKIPVQKMADRVVSIFVPAILVLSASAFIFWITAGSIFIEFFSGFETYLPWTDFSRSTLTLAIVSAISVLIISCPCALGLAVPTAVAVGTGIGASKGILIRKAEAIEIMKDIKTVFFDKTGTLTTGKMKVTDIIPFGKYNNDSLLSLAAGIEKFSGHALAMAICLHASEKKIVPARVTDFRNFPGYGISACIGEKPILAGNERFVSSSGIDTSITADVSLKLMESGRSLIWITEGSELAGVIGFSDTVRHNTGKVISLLHSMGIRTIMLTGDRRESASAAALETGIQGMKCELLPDEKASEVKEMQSKLKSRVAMVGDGINDAPALTQADVGIAIGSGTEIAIESSDIVIVNNNLDDVIKAFKISTGTFRKIRQNLFWAFFYNIAAIPLAFFGLLHPVIAEICMAVSSLIVVSNSLSLNRQKF